MKIVADRDIPFLGGLLEPFAEVVYVAGNAIRADDVHDADALLVRTRTRCDAALLAGSAVSFVGTATIGTDHIDREWCWANGITVCNSAGCNARGVLQWVGAALVWLSQESRVKSQESATRKSLRHLSHQRLITPDSSLITIGVIGVGNVGSLVAEYAEEWGFRVMKSDPPRERAEDMGSKDGYFSFREIVEQADIITLHVPLDGSTRHLVNEKLLSHAGPEFVIINSSRGAVVDPAAVVGRNYIFDVWENEPDIDRATLAGALLATPHIAGYTRQGKFNATALIVNRLARFFGLPLGPIPIQSVARKIGWEQMCGVMGNYFDIEAVSRTLKRNPENFEKMRNENALREEFF